MRGSNDTAKAPESSKIVLVVEDNVALAALVRVQLDLLGYATIAAGTADDALRVLQSDTRIDLLFSDIRLPGTIDGRSLAQMAADLRPGLPCLLTTGYEELDAPARRATAHLPVLPKPFRRSDLAEAVREALAG